MEQQIAVTGKEREVGEQSLIPQPLSSPTMDIGTRGQTPTWGANTLDRKFPEEFTGNPKSDRLSAVMLEDKRERESSRTPPRSRPSSKPPTPDRSIESPADLRRQLAIMAKALKDAGVPMPTTPKGELSDLHDQEGIQEEPAPSNMPSSSRARPLFIEAERRIIAKGEETALRAAAVQEAEANAQQQLRAQQQTWEALQVRAERDRQEVLNAQLTLQQEATQAENAIRQEQERITAEQQRTMQAQLAIEQERTRTLEIQAEVERQVKAKELEMKSEADRLAYESAAVARARQECEQKVSQIRADYEALAKAQLQQQSLRQATPPTTPKTQEPAQMATSSQQPWPMPSPWPSPVAPPPPQELGQEDVAKQVQTQLAPVVEMMRGLFQRMDQIERPPLQPAPRSTASAGVPSIVEVVNSTRGARQGGPIPQPREQPDRSRDSSPDDAPSDSGFSLTPSALETYQRLQRSQQSPPGDGSGDPIAAVVGTTGSSRRKELDEIKGIPSYPTTPEVAGWLRETRYAVAAASTAPKKVLKRLLEAEKWTGDVLLMPTDPELETLEVKFGKALRAIIKGDNKRELANLEERVLREHQRLLNGTEIYIWIVRQFTRDARLARPQVLREIAMIKIGTGKHALRTFMGKWDAAVERLVGLGGSKEGDEEHLYIHFKENFMASPDMAECAARIRTSLPSSRVHTYKYMYDAVEARLQTMRLEAQEAERIAACKPETQNPMTPGIEGNKGKKGKGKGKDENQTTQPKKDTANLACPRMVKDGKCRFGDDKCWYSHSPKVIAKAKQAAKPKAEASPPPEGKIQKTCKFWKAGNCTKGNDCKYLHSELQPAAPAAQQPQQQQTQNGAEVTTVALGMVVLSEDEQEEVECKPCDGFANPSLEAVPDEHLKNNHFPPLPQSCPICRRAQLTEEPARRNPHPDGDERLKAEAFGDVVDIDTLFFTKGKDDQLSEAAAADPSLVKGHVIRDHFTRDIEYYPVKDRSAAEARESFVNFGGSRTGIKKCVTDMAPELVRACKDLDIAVFEATPGRSTSHATIERANRTVLERTRPALAQSGLSIDWAGRCAKHTLVVRRLQIKDKDGKSIYELKHPGAKKPPIWAFGSKVDFKPTKDQMTQAKVLPRGKEGILIGYHMNPGGSWSGDFYCAELSQFGKHSGARKIRVHRTKTVTWKGDSRPEFPLYDAAERAKAMSLAEGMMELNPELEPEAEEDEDLLKLFDEFAPTQPEPTSIQEMYMTDEALEQLRGMEEAETPPTLSKPPSEFLALFRLGGWYRRLPRIDPSTCKQPNTGSKRPPDIHIVTWAGCGQAAQDRELACRDAESRGEGPPDIDPAVASRLPADCQAQIVKVLERQIEVTEKLIKDRQEGEAASANEPAAAATCSSGGNKPQKPDDGKDNEAKKHKPSMALQAYLTAWPEGEEASEALCRWCEDEGVPAPAPPRTGHRQQNGSEEQLGFGLVTRPISPGSAEWKSKEGQDAIMTEMNEHRKRGTWNLANVRELSDIVAESHNTGKDVILGGVHPILGMKGAEGTNPTMRCRIVFTAPRARTASGLDVQCLYEEVSASPITFQGSRTLRAYGALKGWVISSRDAKSAYLQSELRRPDSDDPVTWVALPAQFQPMVELVLSLYGHPVAGNRWDGQMDKSVHKASFQRAQPWKGIYKQDGTDAGLGVYVDDFELVASAEDTPKIWKQLEKHIEFGGPHQVWGEKDTRHLGCQYQVSRLTDKKGEITTKIRAAMPDYFEDMVRRFESRMGIEIKPVDTPWLDAGAEKRHKEELSQPGKYGWVAASPLMSGLYGARSCRPDVIIPTIRGSRRITKWTAFDDRRLIRYLGYLRRSAGLALTGSLSTQDLDTAVLRVWPDADLAGEPLEDAKSTSGCWIELASPCGERSMGLHWGAAKQGGVADSTTMAELDSMHTCLKTDALPIASLLEFFLRRPIIMEVKEDNTTAILAAKEGYTPRLRYLHRKRRIDLAWLKEVFDDPNNKLEHTSSEDQKGDLLTKELPKPEFEKKKSLLGLGAVLLHDTVVGKRYKCSGGSMALLACSDGKGDVCNPGVDSWVIDTGSGHHLMAKSCLDAEEFEAQRKSTSSLKLSTANGPCSADTVTDVRVRALGEEAEVRVLPKTPRVLSVSKLVEDGAEFWWTGEGAFLQYKGKVHKLPVQKGVPLLAI